MTTTATGTTQVNLPTNFLFSEGFCLFLIIVFGGLAIVFLLGKGQKILDLFGGKSQQQYSMTVKRKKTPEEELQYQRAIGVFLVVLAVDEAVMMIFSSRIPNVAMLSLVVTIVALVVLVIYLRKKFPDC